jgi:hypothetical protein
MTWWASFNNTTNWWDIWRQWLMNKLLWSICDMILLGKAEVLRENLSWYHFVHIPNRLAWDQTQAFVVRGLKLVFSVKSVANSKFSSYRTCSCNSVDIRPSTVKYLVRVPLSCLRFPGFLQFSQDRGKEANKPWMLLLLHILTTHSLSAVHNFSCLIEH